MTGIGQDRQGDQVEAQAATLPHYVNGGDVVGANFVGGADDDLVVDHQRRGPRAHFVAFFPPELLARVFIERSDE